MFKKLIAAGFVILSSTQAFADGIPVDAQFPIDWAPIITLSGGPAWSEPGQNLYLYPLVPGPQVNFFIHNSPISTIATGEIFFGLQHFISPVLIGELGLGVAGASDADVTGTVNVNGTPSTSTYRYKLDHGRLELKGRLITTRFGFLQPYVSGSLGVGMNQSHDYRATTIDPTFYPIPWFKTHTTMSFPYSLGLGIQTQVFPNWIFGVGYEFADLGRSYLGLDLASNINGPYLSHAYTNALLFSLSYMC